MKNPFLLSVLMAALGSMMAGRMTAQTFTTIHGFTDGNEAGGPQSDLLLLGNTLYGTTLTGGSLSMGTVFALRTDGMGFTNLYTFTGGSDGARPGHASLVSSGNTLYGTTFAGGDWGNGTVFAINTDGTGFMNLYSFTGGSDGGNPASTLILSSNTLYGATYSGGSSGYGTVFAINTDGRGFATLYSFGGSDGANPVGGLILSGHTLYGTTSSAITSGLSFGTVFAINTDGTGFTNLHSFAGGSDGANPGGGLVLSSDTLYGTASGGGSGESGTVFAIDTGGNGFTVLYNFTRRSGSSPYGNSDGSLPNGGLLLSGNTLYGTASQGGTGSYGTVFAVKTDGTGFTNLHSFTGGGDGAYPRGAGLTLSGSTVFGTAAGGGTWGKGTIFSISSPVGVSQPQLTITGASPNVILTWPTNFTGYTLQSTTNLGSPVWSTNSPTPVVVNGQFTVTNPISGTQQFFRLSQ